MAELAGPKIGDARSLWNFTPSPGWTKEEVGVLRLCLMKFGVGMWVQIVEAGVLPGKQIQQLNGQTQRFLGQQSLAEYTRLKVDVDAIRADNLAKQGPEIYRKNGLITNQGGKLKPDALRALREANEAKYGLTDEQVEAIVLPDPPKTTNLGADAYMGKNHNKGGIAGRRALKRSRVDDVMTVDVDALSRPNKLLLLAALRARLVVLASSDAKKTPTKKVLEEKKPAGGGVEKNRTEKKKPTSATKKRRTSGENAAPASSSAVKDLVGMGFPAKKARDAIEATGGDVQDCVNWLVANM
mgnify:CR=1 FL=1|jgi:hypothetical protein